MLDGSNRARWALITGVLLLTVAFAGCAQDQAPGEDPSDGSEDVSQAEARSSFQKAMDVFQDSAQDQDRIQMRMEFTTPNGTGEQTGTVDALYDADQNMSIMSMSGMFAEGTSGPGASGPSGSIDVFVAAQVHKTSFFGVPPSVLGFYNESQEPPEGFTSVDASPDAGGSDGDSGTFSDPTTLMSDLSEEPPEEAEFTATETTHKGQEATEITATYRQDNATYDVRVIVYTETGLPALLEGEVTPDEDAPSKKEAGSFSVEFAYGEDATHEHEQAFVRLESMTYSTGEPQGMMMGQQSSERYTNRTIQPSQNPGLVPLEEIQVQVTSESQGSMAGGENGTEPVLTLDPDEQTTAENENVSVTYEDADGDGAVSPGDRIVLEDLNTSDSERFSLQLHDEVTGMNLTPGLGVLSLLAGVALAAVGRRRA